MKLFKLGLLSLLLQASHSSSHHHRRADEPSMPISPGTIQNCASWYGNDGSFPCELIPYTGNSELEDFIKWNPSITAECENFNAGYSYCVQEKEAPAPVSSTTTKLTTAPPSSTTLVPSKTTPRGRLQLPSAGMASKHPTQPSLNPTVGTNCQSLLVDYWVCVSVVGWTAASPTTPSNGITTPMPVQTGVTKNCNKFHRVKSTTTCASIQDYYKISFADFYACNPAVGVIGQKPTTTQPSTGIATPTPIQSGMVKGCKKFDKVKSTTTCASIQDYYNITMANLYKWNPAIGSTLSSPVKDHLTDVCGIMDDLLALTDPIMEKMEQLKALNEQFKSPEVVARSQRRKQIKELIPQKIKTARADTRGDVDAHEIEELSVEKYILDKQIKEDRHTFARRFQALELYLACKTVMQSIDEVISPLSSAKVEKQLSQSANPPLTPRPH
ncbi:Autolysin [Fusarium beomiforme]|uniref:Autolysin n=1 Tax=Fusarium beomiforme TaxID=44412 RepID=A0A9P5A8S9_9HYPO|nr:Autolysin [Fusarium beomiforme]